MKKAKKVFIALVLGIVMMFGVAGCNTQNELQAKIDDLHSRIEELEEQIRERDEKIEQLENELAEKCTGTFYTLREAYDNGFLDRSDIMHISYYLRGFVHEENGKAVDFVPEKTLSNLDEKIVDDIKKAYFNTYPKVFQDSDGSYRYGKEILKIDFFGEYNNYYVVIVDSDLWCYGDLVYCINIDGIVWSMSGAPIMVFSYNK